MKPAEQGEKLNREVNARFGFSYACPPGWIETEPTNLDGKTFVDPEEARVEIRVYAQHAVVCEALDQWVQWVLDLENRSSAIVIIRDFRARVVVETKKSVDDYIQARTVVYEQREGGDNFRVSWTFTQAGTTQYAVRCKAPVEQFDRYQELFTAIASGLRVSHGRGN